MHSIFAPRKVIVEPRKMVVVPQRIIDARWELSKGPAQKRRLARRLEERRQREAGMAPARPVRVEPPAAPPPPKPPDERKAIRVARRAKRLRRKIKMRQRMAARSGLPELTRRGPAPGRASSCSTLTTVGFPANSAGDSGTAEECNELHSSSKRETPVETSRIKERQLG